MSNEHEEPVVIELYKTEFEAMLTKNMLEEAGIPCEVVGGMTAGFRAETPGFVEVLVPGQYAERALKLLIASTKEQSAEQEESSETPSDGDGEG